MSMEFWDKCSDNPTSGRDSDTPPTQLELSQRLFIEGLVGDPTGLKILKTDLWNEGGRVGCFDVTKFRDVEQFVGVDISRKTCDKAAKNHDWIEIEWGPVPPVLRKYGDASFDLILDISTIDHIEDYIDAVAEYGRLLPKDGRLFIVWNRPNLIGDVFVRVRKWMKGIKYIKFPYHYKYSVKDVIGALERNRFRVVDQGGWNPPWSRLLSGDRDWHHLSHWAMVKKV